MKKTLLLLFLIPFFSCFGECKGRIDAGPALATIDMLESGKVRRSLDLFAFRADATFLVYQGLCIKPMVLLADGRATLNTVSIGLGYCIPVTDSLVLTPSFGFSETHFKSKINFPEFGLYGLHEKFVSRGEYIALDAAWTFIEKWRLYGSVQYAWSRVHSSIKPLFKSKDDCKGPVYSLAIERDINDSFSVSLAGGYNLSLSKEKHGLRGKGVKLGLVWWY